MNQIASNARGNIENYAIPPALNLLTTLCSERVDGCLKVAYKSFHFFIYLNNGQITYATHSLEPFERLERHLRRLSQEILTVNNEIRSQLRLLFDEEENNFVEQPKDHEAIAWLLAEKYLSERQAELLIQRLIQEVFESYLLIKEESQNNFISDIILTPPISSIELSSIISKCQKRLEIWQSLSPHILSSYQRPYFFTKSGSKPEEEKLGKILRGFNFRQLAALLNQDELELAKKIYPLIIKKKIIIREPQSPLDRLPFISVINNQNGQDAVKQEGDRDQDNINFPDFSNSNIKQKQWKIVCIDDSPTILNEISRFLSRDEFSVSPITEPLKALMKIIRIEPDLILMDVGMPNIDGYKLCSLIRKYSAFQNTPIIMVTGNKGLIDRAKARIAGATDYMTKPFTQSDLLSMVFKYLS
ncbi:MAG: response regulator [Xenococcaceae cyanobacterium MO_188.B32]|nr:response regulator [Xenococcaceae cyanobacterium MO_188.B32]